MGTLVVLGENHSSDDGRVFLCDLCVFARNSIVQSQVIHSSLRASCPGFLPQLTTAQPAVLGSDVINSQVGKGRFTPASPLTIHSTGGRERSGGEPPFPT